MFVKEESRNKVVVMELWLNDNQNYIKVYPVYEDWIELAGEDFL